MSVDAWFSLVLGVAVVLFAAVTILDRGERLRRLWRQRDLIARFVWILSFLGAVALLATRFGAPVLAASVALNIALGGSENFPFSRFPMFSRPPRRAWHLDLQTADGRRVGMNHSFGVLGATARKLFAKELESHGGEELIDARRLAAEAVHAHLMEVAAAKGMTPVDEPLRMLLVEYELVGDRIEVSRSVLWGTAS